MSRALLIAAAVCLAAASTVTASTRIIPVAGHLPGANGTSWTTDVSLTNNTTAAVVVTLVFHPEDGIDHTRVVTLDARQSLLLDDAVGPDRFPGTNPDATTSRTIDSGRTSHRPVASA
jgi:hypothetical protein